MLIRLGAKRPEELYQGIYLGWSVGVIKKQQILEVRKIHLYLTREEKRDD
jgi:hypothetical protein